MTRHVGLFGVATATLLIAWAFAGPPGTGPDEPGHYVRALGAGGGHFTGERFVPTAAERQAFVRNAGRRKALGGPSEGAGGTRRLRWLNRVTRRFPVARKLSDTTFTGTGELADTRPASGVGTYQPYSLVAAGAAMRAAGDSPGAVRVGRLTLALFSLLMLLAAAALLYDARAPGLSLAGLLAAVTPMVLFTGAIISPSGPETVGAICFAAAGLRVLREPGPASRLVWIALAVSGTVLASARTLGPAFLLLIAGALVGLAGRDRASSAWRANRAAAFPAAALVGLGVVAGLVWELAYMPHPSTSLSRLFDEIGPSISRLPGLLREAVGIFGGLDSKLPVGAFLAWLAIGAAVIGAALRFGDGRDRRTVLGLVAAAPLLCVALSVSQLQTGFGLQGRHVLALLALVPLICGEIVLRRRDEIPSHLRLAIAVGVPAAAGIVQGVAWLANAHHYAGGSWLLGDAAWEPPLGWYPWLALAAVGTAAYLALAVTEGRRTLRSAAETRTRALSPG